eukprot:4294061-Pleurochrysis_carterae.AAC.4
MYDGSIYGRARVAPVTTQLTQPAISSQDAAVAFARTLGNSLYRERHWMDHWHQSSLRRQHTEYKVISAQRRV